MKEVHRQGIEYHTSKTELQNHNLFEVVIREVRQKWYRTMVQKRVPRQLWNYSVSWVSEVMSITND